MRWVQKHREKTGQDFSDLIEPVARKANSLDAQRLRAEAAESALKDIAWRFDSFKSGKYTNVEWLVDSSLRTLSQVGF